MGVLAMHNEKHQFEVKKRKGHRTVGRLGGGYVVGGIPWSQLYFGGYGYYGGYYGGVGPGNDNSPNETAQNGFGQESNNDSGDNSGSDAGAGDGGGAGSM
jgi:hypothetical protein